MKRTLTVTTALWLVFASSLVLDARQPRAVQVGWCTPLKTLEAAKTAGFDYAELGTTELATMSDADFEQAAQLIQRIGLPVPVTNLFLPGSLKVTGPQIDPAAQLAYVRTAFTRLQKIGTTIVVFGSGGARRIPDGFDKAEAFTQLVDFGKRVAPEAQAHGITVAIEPLRRQESNIINSAGEGLELVNAINHPNFQLMIDFYHLASEKEDPADRDPGGLAHPPPAHRESDRAGVPARVDRVRLCAVLRQPAQDRLRQTDQRRGLDDRLPGPGAAQHCAAATRLS